MKTPRVAKSAWHAPHAGTARAVTNGHRPRGPFLAAVEGAGLASELRRLLTDLLGPIELEVIPQDGPIALARLRSSRPRLAFLSMELNLMEGLTLLRALPAGRARQVVLLVPDTLEGYRRAWEGLYCGARDFLVTRGSPPQRIKGRSAVRLRQLAHLLDVPGLEGPDAAPGLDGAWEAVLEAEAAGLEPEERAPWVVFAESRHLPAVAAWLRHLPPGAPIVLRVPEGLRFARVAREGLGRLLSSPVRMVADGDRLVPGHVHLLHDNQVPWIEHNGLFPRLREVALADPPGSWCAQMTLLLRLAASTVSLRVVLPEVGALDRLEFLAVSRGRHAVYRLSAAAAGTAEGRNVGGVDDEQCRAG